MTTTPPRPDSDTRRAGIRRTAWIAAASALAVYVAFLWTVLSP